MRQLHCLRQRSEKISSQTGAEKFRLQQKMAPEGRSRSDIFHVIGQFDEAAS